MKDTPPEPGSPVTVFDVTCSAGMTTLWGYAPMSARVTRTVPGRTCTVIGMKRRVLVPVRVTCWTAPAAAWPAGAEPDPVADAALAQPATAMAATAMAATAAPAARPR